MDEYFELAKSLGFEPAACVPMDALVCHPELRALCNPEQCPGYGTNWICPPGCGELPDLEAQLAEYGNGIIVQSVYEDVDTSDPEFTHQKLVENSNRLAKLSARVRSKHPNALVLTSGGCLRCEKCTYPDEPCRKPEEKQGSISAHGIDLVELCEKADVPYAFVPEILRFVSIVLY